MAVYFLAVIISCVITYPMASVINAGLIGTLLIRLLICIIIPNAVFFIMFGKTNEFKQSILLVDNMTKGKIRIRDILHRLR